MLACLAFVSMLAVAPLSTRTAAAAEPLASQETNTDGIMAEVTECRRKEGVLNIRVRFKNTGDEDKQVYVDGSGYDNTYLTAEKKKYLVLKDSQNKPLASPTYNIGVKKGGSYVWWAKYPAPPDAVKKVTFYSQAAPPIGDIPIQD